MTDKRVTLKSISFSERLSQETNAFAADVYFDGKKIAYANNDGHGGCTNIQYYPNMQGEYRKFEAYAKALPDYVYDRGGVNEFSIKMDDENLVDMLFETWLEEKNKGKYLKKMQKEMLTCLILSKTPTLTNAYSMFRWKCGSGEVATIAEVVARVPHKVKAQIEQYKKEGWYILNTNIPKELM